MDKEEILKGLNSDQRRAVLFDHAKEGPLLVLAAAGSGKTSVLTRRIQWRILQGVKPESILALTFTAKAAEEMRSRVQKIFPGAKIRLCTFHSLAYSILREKFSGKFGWELAGFSKAPVPSEGEEERFACSLVERGIASGAIARDDLFRQDIADKLAIKLAPIREEVLESGKIVFEDLIYLATKLISNEPLVQNALRNRFREVMVDEYQDINSSQYLLVRSILGENRSFFAVGDDDQAIYGFRGADIGNVFRFCKDFPNSTILRLEWNYRSVPKILYLANRIFDRKPLLLCKTLRPGNGRKDPLFLENRSPELWESPDPYTEIMRMVQRMKEMRADYSLAWSDFAVLSRYNRQRLYYEAAFAEWGIPVWREGEDENPDIAGVHVETVHGSKGLEYPVVFYAGLAEKLSPGECTGKRKERKKQEDEEKRLFYVGVTRAEAVLILLYCKRRYWKGRLFEFKPSRYLRYLELPIREKSFMPMMLFRIRSAAFVLAYMLAACIPFFSRLLFAKKSVPFWVDRKIRSFGRFCIKTLRIELSIENQAVLSRVDWSRPVIVVGNHQSYSDIPIAFLAIGRAVGFLAKKELFYVPCLNFWMNAIHCISVNRKDPRAGVVIKERMEHSKVAPHVFIFPEGTRSKDGSLHPFKSGAFRLACDLDATILPLCIKGSRKAWESRVSTDKVNVSVCVLEPIDVSLLAKEKEVNPKVDLLPRVYEMINKKIVENNIS